MPIPTRLKVGPFVYTVTVDTGGFVSANKTDYGCTDNREGRILLAGGQSASQMRDTLWHELKHAVWYAAAVSEHHTQGTEHAVEENVVAATCTWELGVLRDNPALVAFLLTPDDGKESDDGPALHPL